MAGCAAEGDTVITPDHIVQARKLLYWTRTRLADKAGVTDKTVRRAEKSNGELHVQPVTLARIRRALEMAGVDFAGPQPTIAFKSSQGRSSSRAVSSRG